MRARLTPTRSDVERINNLAFKEQCETIIDNNAVFLITVKRFFKMGTKRTRAFLKMFNMVKKEFDLYESEAGTEYFRKKVGEELELVGIDASSLWNIEESYSQVTDSNRKKSKNRDFTTEEARSLKENLIHIKRVVK